MTARVKLLMRHQKDQLERAKTKVEALAVVENEKGAFMRELAVSRQKEEEARTEILNCKSQIDAMRVALDISEQSCSTLHQQVCLGGQNLYVTIYIYNVIEHMGNSDTQQVWIGCQNLYESIKSIEIYSMNQSNQSKSTP
jgi:hypothetical protein